MRASHSKGSGSPVGRSAVRIKKEKVDIPAAAMPRPKEAEPKYQLEINGAEFTEQVKQCIFTVLQCLF